MLLPRLKDLREDKDLSQTQVADILCVAARTYSGYETGDRQIPLECLITLARFYNVSLDYIAGLQPKNDA